MTIQREKRFDLAVLSAWVLVLAAFRAGRVSEGDPYWQIRAGGELLDGGPLVHPDSWSWAPVVGNFYPNSPAWNVLLAISWRSAAYWGLFAVTFVSISAVLGLLAYLTMRVGVGPLSATAAVVVCAVGAFPMLSPRPSVGAQLLLLLGFAAADSWSQYAWTRPTWVTAVVLSIYGFSLSYVGSWVHSSWSILALGLGLSWSVFWAMVPKLHSRTRIAAILGGSLGLVAGVGLGPYGLAVLERSWHVAEVASGLIIEWTAAADPRNAERWIVPAALAVVLSVVAAIRVAKGWRRRPSRELALEAALVVIALPAAIAGLVLSIRFCGVAWLLLAPTVGLTLSRVAGRATRAGSGPKPSGLSRFVADRAVAPYWRILLGASVAALAPLAVLIAMERAQPASASALPPLPLGCRLYADAADSGAALLLRPDVLVWYDGRTDYWGRDRVAEAASRIANPSLSQPAPPGATCALFRTSGEFQVVAAALDASPDWQRRAEVGEYVVWLAES